MPNSMQCEQLKDDLSSEQRQALDSLIREQVIHILGTPADLHRIQICKIWPDHYRVNVLIGANAGSARVANSFFVVVDSHGKVIKSTPEIARSY